MIVTASTLMGLISMNGSFETHCAMLIMLLWQVEKLRIPRMPMGIEQTDEPMEPGFLWKLCVALHIYLLITTYMNQSPHFSNGIMLQVANFVGLGFYMYFISKIAIE